MNITVQQWKSVKDFFHMIKTESCFDQDETPYIKIKEIDSICNAVYCKLYNIPISSHVSLVLGLDGEVIVNVLELSDMAVSNPGFNPFEKAEEIIPCLGLLNLKNNLIKLPNDSTIHKDYVNYTLRF